MYETSAFNVVKLSEGRNVLFICPRRDFIVLKLTCVNCCFYSKEFIYYMTINLVAVSLQFSSIWRRIL